jgi:hypothetical protein
VDRRQGGGTVSVATVQFVAVVQFPVQFAAVYIAAYSTTHPVTVPSL